MEDLGQFLELEDMPVCPLCGNAVTEDDPCMLVIAHGVKALVHTICFEVQNES